MTIRKKLRIFFEIILGIHKTIYFNFHYLPIRQAIKFPVLISKNCKLIETKGKVFVDNSKIKKPKVLIGFGTLGFIDSSKNKSIIEFGRDSVIRFMGNCRLGGGVKISSSGELVLGNNVTISGDSLIICKKKISIGDNCLLSWKVEIIDSDFHKIISNNEIINIDSEIKIESDVWICSGVKILKSSLIPLGCVVGSNSLINKKYDLPFSVLGGIPAKVLKTNIKWEK